MGEGLNDGQFKNDLVPKGMNVCFDHAAGIYRVARREPVVVPNETVLRDQARVHGLSFETMFRLYDWMKAVGIDLQWVEETFSFDGEGGFRLIPDDVKAKANIAAISDGYIEALRHLGFKE